MRKTTLSMEEPDHLDVDGVWAQILRPPAAAGRACLFLDRDGVIVAEIGHLRRAADVRLLPGAAEVIAAANRRGVPVVVATNQSGIGQGLFSWRDFRDVQARMIADLAACGAVIDAVFGCPHHPQARPPYDHPDHPARKPNPGMLLKAAAMMALDLKQSWIVGDRWRDLGAGLRAGLAGGLLVGDIAGEREAGAAFLAAADVQAFRAVYGKEVTEALALPIF